MCHRSFLFLAVILAISLADFAFNWIHAAMLAAGQFRIVRPIGLGPHSETPPRESSFRRDNLGEDIRREFSTLRPRRADVA